jgi:hypothetical protein
VVEQTAFGVEVNDQINVAALIGLAARHKTEDAHVNTWRIGSEFGLSWLSG